ncbi:3-methyl-2-oxobutanoate hydroxymethyltransferase [soil metagenome]
MTAATQSEPPITVPHFRSAKERQQKLTVLTCYDYTFAKLLDVAGVEALLVGDSLGMVIQGQQTSLRVTMRQMIYHTECVARGAKRALVIGDLPFLSYQTSPRDAVKNAGRLLQAGAAAVKLEGGARMAEMIAACVRADIPVMAHIGLTPQSVHATGGFKVQRDAERLMQDAKAVEAAGAFAIVIESVPVTIAAAVTAAVKVPTIGIGAGAGCDGQVLVLHDMLGLYPDFRPRFVKQYAPLGDAVTTAVRQYCKDVKLGTFPATEHTFN